jgi:acetyl-CoA acyltransferase
MQEAVIIDCLRTAVGKAPRGALRTSRPDDLAGAVVSRLLGQATPKSRRMKSRISSSAAPCPKANPATTWRAAWPCAPACPIRHRRHHQPLLQFRSASHRHGRRPHTLRRRRYHHRRRRRIHEPDPRGGHKPAPNPWFVDHWPEIYMSMGLTAERVQRKYNVSREAADAFSFRSHQNALRAQAEGKFDDEIVPVEFETGSPQRKAPQGRQNRLR